MSIYVILALVLCFIGLSRFAFVLVKDFYNQKKYIELKEKKENV